MGKIDSDRIEYLLGILVEKNIITKKEKRQIFDLERR